MKVSGLTTIQLQIQIKDINHQHIINAFLSLTSQYTLIVNLRPVGNIFNMHVHYFICVLRNTVD